MKKLVIAGGNGFLGQVVAKHFLRKSWHVTVLTRRKTGTNPAAQETLWDPSELGPWTEELEGADALLNLCGKSVDCRYHARNRKALFASRIGPTTTLGQAISKLKNPPKVWLNAASATTYRHSLSTPMDDYTGEHGTGFSVELCRAWENAFFAIELPATRRVALRTSMVLGDGQNSVFPVLARLARFGLGGKFSRGDQMMSWIHELDFARAIDFIIDEPDIAGAINVTAPAPVRNDVFMKQLRDAIGTPFGLPHFKPMLEIAAWLMRTETELTLKSRYVIPAKLLEQRFLFRFPFIDEAFADLANRISSKTRAIATDPRTSNLLAIHEK